MRLILLFTFLSLIINPVFGQTYNTQDKQIIESYIKGKMSLYQQVLNLIAYEGTSDSNAKDYANTAFIEIDPNTKEQNQGQLFYSKESVVEDDIRSVGSRKLGEEDLNAESYLMNFHLMYSKSENQTITYSDFEYLPLKYEEYLYMQVKCLADYKGFYKGDSSTFEPFERVFEFRIEKRNNRWVPLIVSIRHLTDELDIYSTDNTVELDSVSADQTLDMYGANAQLRYTEEFERNKAKDDSTIAVLIDKGDKAVTEGRYEDGYKAYNQAFQIDNFNFDVKRKINELFMLQNRQRELEAENFDSFKKQGDLAFQGRDYQNAYKFYNSAINIEPNAEIDQRIEYISDVLGKTRALNSEYSAILNSPEGSDREKKLKDLIKKYKKTIVQIEKKDGERNALADYYFGRGMCYETLEDWDKAKEDYSEAIIEDGKFVKALDRRAMLFANENDYPSAIADYTRIITNSTYSVEYLPKRADIYEKQLNLQEAINDYEEVIHLDSVNADAHYNLGRLLRSQKMQNWGESNLHLTKAIDINGNLDEAFFLRGLNKLELKDYSSASIDFRAARDLGLAPNNVFEIRNKSVQFMAYAEDAYRREEYAESVTNYNRAILTYPDDHEYWMRRGDAYVKLNQLDSALFNYEASASRDSLSFVYFKKGQVYELLGDSTSAKKEFAEYTRLGSSLKSKYEEILKNTKAPKARFNDHSTNFAFASYAYGYSLFRLPQSGIEYFDEALKENELFLEAQMGRGLNYYSLNEIKKANKDLEAVASKAYQNPQVYFYLGRTFDKLSDFENANSNYSKAILLDSNYLSAYSFRAKSLIELGRHSDALNDVNTLIENDPYESSDFWYGMKGLLEVRVGQYDQADNSINAALEINPSNAHALYTKALMQLRSGDRISAMELFNESFRQGKLSWDKIKNDQLLQGISRDKDFKRLVKQYDL